MKETMRETIERRLDWMRKRNPNGYAQLCIQPFPLPPSYAREDDSSEWWASQEAKDFAESIKPQNWYE